MRTKNTKIVHVRLQHTKRKNTDAMDQNTELQPREKAPKLARQQTTRIYAYEVTIQITVQHCKYQVLSRTYWSQQESRELNVDKGNHVRLQN